MRTLHNIGKKEWPSFSLADLISKEPPIWKEESSWYQKYYRAATTNLTQQFTTTTTTVAGPNFHMGFDNIRIHAYCETCGKRADAITTDPGTRIRVIHQGNDVHDVTYIRDFR